MIFLTKTQILKIHQKTLFEQGGSDGIRDENGLLSALFAPENRVYYEDVGIIICAATYAFHLISRSLKSPPKDNNLDDTLLGFQN